MLLRIGEQGELLTLDGQRVDDIESGETAVVLLPPSACSITEVEVGPGEARLLRKTLPWRLEDMLLAPPETLHFAHGDIDGKRVAVTIADKRALDNLRSAAREHALSLQAAYAELSLLPWQPGQWTLWPQASLSQILVRHDWHRGFACDNHNLAATLTLLHNEQQAWPQQIVLYGTQQQYDTIRQGLPGSLQPLLVLRRAPAWDELLAAAPLACNVLQGKYAPPLPWQRWWQQWRVAAVLLAALLIGDAGFTLAHTWQLQSQRQVAQQQLTEQFRRVQAQGPMVEPLVQLRQLLAQGGGQHALLPLLTQMAPVLASEPATVIDLLDFDAVAGSLQLDLHGASLASIENLRGKLQRAGIAVELVGSASEGSSSRARLRVVAP